MPTPLRPDRVSPSCSGDTRSRSARPLRPAPAGRRGPRSGRGSRRTRAPHATSGRAGSRTTAGPRWWRATGPATADRIRAALASPADAPARADGRGSGCPRWGRHNAASQYQGRGAARFTWSSAGERRSPTPGSATWRASPARRPPRLDGPRRERRHRPTGCGRDRPEPTEHRRPPGCFAKLGRVHTDGRRGLPGEQNPRVGTPGRAPTHPWSSCRTGRARRSWRWRGVRHLRRAARCDRRSGRWPGGRRAGSPGTSCRAGRAMPAALAR